MSNPRSSQFRMADRLSKGKLVQTLLDFDAEGASPHYVARELYARFGVEVTAQTIYNWLAIIKSTDTADAAS